MNKNRNFFTVNSFKATIFACITNYTSSLIQLSEIWIYPIKSLGGIRLTNAQVEGRGLQYDRRWLVIDENARFLTQREINKMAIIDVAILQEGLLLSHRFESGNSILLPYKPVTAVPLNVTIWDDTVEAVTVSNEVDEWLSNQFDQKVRVVMMPESTERKADPQYALNGENVSFADGFPFLLISEASLEDLNNKLANVAMMRRFRPNFVVSGAVPFSEDSWKSIQIGTIRFKVVKPCARCVLTTIDPETGEKGVEPLKTLSSYRRVNNKVLFGQNLVASQTGVVREGDKIELL